MKINELHYTAMMLITNRLAKFNSIQFNSIQFSSVHSLVIQLFSCHSVVVLLSFSSCSGVSSVQVIHLSFSYSAVNSVQFSSVQFRTDPQNLRCVYLFGVDYDSPKAKCGQGVYKIYMGGQVYDWTVNSNN